MKCYEKQPEIVSESNEIHVSAQSATFGILSHIRTMFCCYGGALFQYLAEDVKQAENSLCE